MKYAVVSLYDYTAEAVKPWAEAGYTCFCLDIQHEGVTREGNIVKVHWDRSIGAAETFLLVSRLTVGYKVRMGFAFPVCTDLAASGARHWKRKGEVDPEFQTEAAGYATDAAWVFAVIGCPWVIENPAGALSRLWRKPDYSFDPCEYGGYLDEGPHPTYPEYIPPQDAYRKRTFLWTGGGFRMPPKLGVEPEVLTYTRQDGSTTRGSRQWGKLGGKSLKTKNIRSATPRGFAAAVFAEHGD